MTRRSFLPRLVLVFLIGKLINLTLNLLWFPRLRPGPNPEAELAVPLLVPMRDEAARLPDTVPGLLSATHGPIVFLDDESTDGSAGLVRTLTGGDPRVTVLAGRPRPTEWTGKTWACAQLAEHATTAGSQVLLFCDADVRLAPGAVSAVLAEMHRQRADVFSVFPRQLTGTWPERLLMPLIDDVVLCFLPHKLLTAPVPAAATASGTVLGFRVDAYHALGGFAAVRDQVVEDVAIARLVRRRGLTLGLALGGDVARVRMYRSGTEVVDGMGRGLVPAVGGRRSLVLLGWCWHVLAYTVPALCALRSGPRATPWRIAALLGVLERLLVEAKTGGRDWPAAAAVALSPLFAAPVVIRAMRGRHLWKGRVYG